MVYHAQRKNISEDAYVKRSHLAREIVETIVITLIIFIVIRLMIQSYHIDGVSMQPGLTDGQYVVVNKTAYLLHPPERGDVIVFHFPRNTQVDFIKRVIGLPGDTVKTDGTRVWVNGILLNEPYISSPANPSAKEWKVPANQYYVLV